MENDANSNIYKKNNRKIRVTFIIIFSVLFIIGISLIIVNCSFYANMSGYLKCDAKIVDVIRQSETVIEYYFKGEKITKRIGEYIFTYKIGGTIQVFLNPTTGELIRTSGRTTIYWMASGFTLTIGGIGLLVIIKNTIKDHFALKKLNENKEVRTNIGLSDFEKKLLNISSSLEEHKEEIKPMETYNFKRIKSITDYQMLDKDNKQVFISKKIKSHLFRGYTYEIEFNNLITNKSEIHNVGKMVSVSNSYSSTNSSNMPFMFRIDDLKIWDLLDNVNIRISGSYQTGEIYLKNEKIATFNQIEAKKPIFATKRPINMTVTCSESYLDLVFLTMFIVSYPPIGL